MLSDLSRPAARGLEHLPAASLASRRRRLGSPNRRAVFLWTAASFSCQLAAAVLSNRTAWPAPDAPPSSGPYAVLRASDYAEFLGTDLEWADAGVPLLDFPADGDLLKTYYYRWRLLRKHLATAGGLTVLTEFLGKRPIPAAAGHHLVEAQYLRNASVADEYLEYWLDPSRLEGSGDFYSYSNWIGHAAVSRRRRLLGPSPDGLSDRRLLELLVGRFSGNPPRYLFNRTQDYPLPCWWQNDREDAMEVSISGPGCRPTINSIMYGEAQAIMDLALELGEYSIATSFRTWAEMSRQAVHSLWNPAVQWFTVVSLPDPTKDPPVWRPLPHIQNLTCDLKATRTPYKAVAVRELLGLVPFYFIDSDSARPLLSRNQILGDLLNIWPRLFSSEMFAGPWGLRTAERRHPCYNFTWDKSSFRKRPGKPYSDRNTWNANSWPYETSRVLTGMAAALRLARRDGVEPQQALGALTVDRFWQLLRDFARQHTRTFALQDTAIPKGSGHVFENLHPDLGYWNTRQWRSIAGMSPAQVNVSNDYFHSSFIDLVIADLIGLRGGRGRDGKQMLFVRPLIPAKILSTMDAFALDGVSTWAGDVAVVYDRDGLRYGKGTGFRLLINGTLVAKRASVGVLKYTKNLGLPYANQ